MARFRLKPIHLLDFAGHRGFYRFNKAIDLFGIRFYDDFHSAVWAILNRALNVKSFCDFVRGKTKSDSLYSAGEEKNRANHGLRVWG